MMEISDQELLKNWCRQRDALAFQAIVQRHATMVFHTALRILRNPSDAEDATQLCFEKLVKIDKTTNIRSLGAWLHGVATNLSISFIRTKSRRSKREEEYAEINCTTDDAKEWNDIYPLIDEAIHDLEDKFRIPIIAHFLEGQTHAAIALDMNVSRSAITKYLNQGIEQVESILKKKGVVPGIALMPLLSSLLNNASAIEAPLISSLGKLALAQGVSPIIEGGVVNSITSITGKWCFAVAVVMVMGVGITFWQTKSSIMQEPQNNIEIAVQEEKREDIFLTTAIELPKEKAVAPTQSTDIIPVAEVPFPHSDLKSSISGKVVNSEGEPMRDWNVYLDIESSFLKAKTDALGRFHISGIPSGTFEIVGRNQQSYASQEIEIPSVPQKIEVVLIYDLGQSISGNITDTEGVPIPNVNVSAYSTLRSARNPNNSITGYTPSNTNDEGLYTIEGIPEIEGLLLRLQVFHNEYMQTYRAGVEPNSTEQNFVLTSKPKVTGRVLDAQTRQPIKKFKIDHWIGDSETNAECLIYISLEQYREHKNGEFSINLRGYGSVRLGASAPGYATDFIAFENIFAGELLTDVEILLDPVLPIKGTVLNEVGSPVKDAKIFLGIPSHVAGLYAQSDGEIARTNSEGTFLLSEYPIDLKLISAYRNGYALTIQPYKTDSKSVTIILSEGSTIKGQVFYGGKPVKKEFSNIAIATPYGDSWIMTTRSKNNGEYTLKVVPLGQYAVVAQYHEEGVSRFMHRTIDIESKKVHHQDFYFDDGYDSYIEGNMFMDGQPARALIRAIVEFDNKDIAYYQTETNFDGSYRLGPVPSGTLEFGALWIQRDDGGNAAPDFELVTTYSGETTRHDINAVSERSGH